MIMSIKIVTDSTSDLPPQIAASLGVTVIPMLIRVGSQVYQDGVDITRKQFYDQLADGRRISIPWCLKKGCFARLSTPGGTGDDRNPLHSPHGKPQHGGDNGAHRGSSG